MKMWIINNDFLKSLAIIFVSAFVIYYLGDPIRHIYFLALLPLIWSSKKDYFWAAVVFIMINYPGGLFYGATRGDSLSLPLYTIGLVSFQFQQLFTVLIFIKAILRRKDFVFIFKTQYQLGALFFLFLIVVSFILGVNFDAIRKIYFFAIGITLYYSLLFVFRKEQYVINFFRIIFPFTFIAIILQIFGIANQSQLISLFKPGIIAIQGVWQGAEIRSIEMPEMLLVSTLGALYFLSSRHYQFNPNYLIFVAAISTLSIVLTGTRGWFLGYAGLIFAFLVVNVKQLKRLFPFIIIGLFIVFLIINYSATLSQQLGNAWTRLSTIDDIVEVRGKGLARADERLPKLIEGIKQSTIIIGAGFSKLYMNYTDTHLGYVNIFLTSGILGYLFYIYFIYSIYNKSLRIAGNNGLFIKKNVRNIFLSLIPLLIINASTQFFGLSLFHIQRVFVVAFVFAWLNSTLSEQIINRSPTFKNVR